MHVLILWLASYLKKFSYIQGVSTHNGLIDHLFGPIEGKKTCCIYVGREQTLSEVDSVHLSKWPTIHHNIIW